MKGVITGLHPDGRPIITAEKKVALVLARDFMQFAMWLRSPFADHFRDWKGISMAHHLQGFAPDECEIVQLEGWAQTMPAEQLNPLLDALTEFRARQGRPGPFLYHSEITL